jgi:hypothetical protein
MSSMRTEFLTVEGVLLLRQDGRTMAVHLTAVTAILEAIVFEPDIPNGNVWFSSPPTLDHYEVEATGRADRIFMWEGTDPFAKPELEPHREAVES